MSLVGKGSSKGGLPVKVYLVQARSAPVGDISNQGISFQTETPLTVGKDYVILLKSKQRKLLLGGRVVRSTPCQGSGEALDDRPAYNNGIAFQLERDDRQVALSCLVQENLFGEKRNDRRSIPDTPIVADVAGNCFSRIESLNSEGMVATGSELMDMEMSWPILIDSGRECHEVTGRILSASKREGDRDYTTKVVFTDSPKQASAFLRTISMEAGSETNEDTLT